MRITAFDKNNKFTPYTHVWLGMLMLMAVCGLAMAENSLSINVLAARIKTASLAVKPGQSATLLPNGNWLLLGGRGHDGRVLDEAWLFNPRTEKNVLLPGRLKAKRSHHTATVLPDGSVLIVGGEDADGTALSLFERYRPETGAFEIPDDLSLGVRSRHSATLLSDGRLLIVGGVGRNGDVLADAVLFDPATLQAESVNSLLNTARFGHSAALLPSGDVLLWSGVDSRQESINDAELYDSRHGRFMPLHDVSAKVIPERVYRLISPAVQATLPEDGASAVPVDVRIAVRFTKPLPVSQINAHTLTLIGPRGAVAAKAVPAEGGLLAFVTPKQQLLPGSRYTLFIEGARDAKGISMPLTTVSFRTATLNAIAPATIIDAPDAMVHAETDASADSNSLDSNTAAVSVQPEEQKPLVLRAAQSAKAEAEDDEIFLPDARHHGGRWRTGRPLPRNIEQRRNTLLARKGPLAFEHAFKSKKQITPVSKSKSITAGRKSAATVRESGISGQVLRLNDRPLANAVLSVGSVSTHTDANGYFHLAGLVPGRHELFVDGAHAGQAGREYGKFVIGVEVSDGQMTEIPPIYLPRLRSDDWIDIPSPTPRALIITHRNVPGMQIHIPKGAVLRDHEGRIVTRIALTPLPLDRVPFAFPENAPVYVSVQPGGMKVEGLSPKNGGIRVIYPNLSGEAPNARADFWRYDPKEKGWYIYGQGRASADAKHIVPDPGIELYDAIGFMYTPWNSPATSPSPPATATPAHDGSCRADPVSCASGLFLHSTVDFVLADVQSVVFSRTYRPNDAFSRAFGFGFSHSYAFYLYFPSPGYYQKINLVLPNGTQLPFLRVSPGSGYNDAILEYTGALPALHKARLSYATATNRWSLQCKDGSVLEFGAYSGFPLLALRDRHGSSLQLVRSGGQLTRIATPNGRTLDLSYDISGRIIQAIDQNERRYTYQYDSGGRLWKAVDPSGQAEEYTYDANRRMTQVKDRRGNLMVVNQYDSAGRVTQQTYPDGGIFRFAYTLDANNRIIRADTVDERGMSERIEFDTDGYVTAQTRAYGTPEAQTTRYEYQSTTHLTTAVIDPLGRRTEYGYDTSGDLTMVTRLKGSADESIWRFTYEPLYHRPATLTDPLGRVTTLTYNDKGNPTRIEDPLGRFIDIAYNGRGQPTHVSQVVNGKTLKTDYAYASGLIAAVTDPLGRTITYSSDTAGRIVAARDPAGRLVRRDYDVLDRLIAITDALGRTTRLEYDANGNVTAYSDAKGQRTLFGYDARNRAITRTDPLGQTDTLVYDKAGLPTSATDRKGQTTQYSYDTLGRPAETLHPGGSVTRYRYDGGNRPIEIQEYDAGNRPTQTLSRRYDNDDRLDGEDSAQGSIDYSYNLLGQRTAFSIAGQLPVNYSYDAGGQLTGISQGTQQVGFEYDELGRRTRLTLPNGLKLDYSYDDAGQLTALNYSQADGTPLGDLTYRYDTLGQRSGQGGSLAQIALPDATTATATHDANNRLIQWNGATLSYDANGNLAGDGNYSYVWDDRDRLSAIQQGERLIASFGYDALGRRISKTVGGQTTQYLHDGWQIVQEQTGDGSMTANLLTGLGLDELYSRTESATSRHFITDALGSVLALADDAGNLATTYRYGPFGETVAVGETSSNPFQYTGRENDGTGLYYYRTRYYHPELQRFISEDPIGLAGGSNLYAYVENNPINLVDPTGETPWGLIFAGADLAWQLYQNGGNVKCVDWSDVGLSMLGGGLLNAIGKGAFRFKTVGSHTWNATRSWMNRRGIQMPDVGQHRHHWLLERNQGIGRYVLDAIKNQPWNTNPISAGFNNWLSRYPYLSWLGGPSWAGEVTAGGVIAVGDSND